MSEARLLRMMGHVGVGPLSSSSSSSSSSLSSSPTSASTKIGRDVVIVSYARTPVGCLNGALSSLSAHELGAVAIKGAIKRAGISASMIEEVFMGNVLQAGQGQAPARQAALRAGIPETAPATTVNKMCASGMKSMIFAAQAIATGYRDVCVVGGMESMSNAPYYVPKARQGYRLGNGTLVDGLLFDGLWDPYNDCHMGMAAEACASKHTFSREEQDRYAVLSYQRAIKASEKGGILGKEIVPVEVKKRKKTVVVDKDEELSRVNLKKLLKLRPAFKRDGTGTVTAGNASTINDGAAAMVLMSRKKANELKVPILATIAGYSDAATTPVEFTTAPAIAIPQALKHAGLSQKEVDLYEINEAFSVVALANTKLLNIDPARVNITGGAVSIGHPIGCSGTRIVGTMLVSLLEGEGKVGCAGICNGGGGASAMVIRTE